MNVVADMIKENEGTPEWGCAGLQFDIANAIAVELEKQERSRSWLAKQLGVNRAWVSRIMHCKENLTLLTLARIGIVLGKNWRLFLVRRNPVATGTCEQIHKGGE